MQLFTLSIISFLYLLLFGLLSWFKIEGDIYHSLKSARLAKNNAYLGASMALGELQETMGPDVPTLPSITFSKKTTLPQGSYFYSMEPAKNQLCLLTNPKYGGFKKNLLNIIKSDENLPLPSSLPISGSFLKSYYNLLPETSSQSLDPRPTLDLDNKLNTHGISPAIIECNFGLYPVILEKNAFAQIHYFIQLTLWNPYNVSLNESFYKFEIAFHPGLKPCLDFESYEQIPIEGILSNFKAHFNPGEFKTFSIHLTESTKHSPLSSRKLGNTFRIFLKNSKPTQKLRLDLILTNEKDQKYQKVSNLFVQGKNIITCTRDQLKISNPTKPLIAANFARTNFNLNPRALLDEQPRNFESPNWSATWTYKNLSKLDNFVLISLPLKSNVTTIAHFQHAFVGPLKEHPTHTIGNAFEYSHQFNDALWDDFFLDSENKFFFKQPFNIHTASPEDWKQLLSPFIPNYLILTFLSKLKPSYSSIAEFINSGALQVSDSISQADILEKIGSRLTIRDDTFVIKVTGTHLNASANCELTVQRIPEYIDTSANSYDDPPSKLKSINKSLGRRFQVTRFEWL